MIDAAERMTARDLRYGVAMLVLCAIVMGIFWPPKRPRPCIFHDELCNYAGGFVCLTECPDGFPYPLTTVVPVRP